MKYVNNTSFPFNKKAFIIKDYILIMKNMGFKMKQTTKYMNSKEGRIFFLLLTEMLSSGNFNRRN